MLEKVLPVNCRISIPEERYADINAYVEIAEAFSRNMFRPVLIVDLYKKDYLYVSDLFSFFLGNSETDQTFSKGQKSVPVFANADIKTLKVVFEKAYELFLSYPIEDRKKLVFSFSFHTNCNGKKRVVHQSLTPLTLTDSGDLWLVLCTASFSSSKSPGHYVMRLHRDEEYMLYNVEKGRWYHKEGVSLSFEEKEILLLSSQGYTVKEIAAVLSKSGDTIKMYKRVMFSKLKVKSIAEAIIAAINGNLI